MLIQVILKKSFYSMLIISIHSINLPSATIRIGIITEPLK